ncbi:uncharacterized protein PV06_09485 [Exophiala oligosperma]|uniref:Ketoreductase domain-containing protein n=2 Tax=Chaetothyriales TaxID=34395 RepID=A0A0D2DSB8_9EURO|nr:uncharacterized protein PV06_09485 [Exophiala oligosperma]KAJ9637551.1 hypothetical protein H2204_004700 [Knufia peltigerae]KIW38529.1 hypothetical protein PV06_09485 [Exophiala oligosperma]
MEIGPKTTAVVTGAGGGIGRSIVLSLANKGAAVVVADIDEDAALKVAEEAKGLGAKSLGVKVDVSKLEDVERLASLAYDQFGSVEILVNNAGVTMRPFRASWDTSLKDFKWTMAVNFWGVLHGHLVFVPRMRETPGRKHIVNTSSMSTLIAFAGHSAYSASKGAVDGFSFAAREELKTQNIGLSILHPGPVRTRIVTSERLRPQEDNSEVRKVKPWSDYLENGGSTTARVTPSTTTTSNDPSFPEHPYHYINPDECGRFILEGIQHDKPVILTHPPQVAELDERRDAILAGAPVRAGGA